jgi:hypothetical protein
MGTGSNAQDNQQDNNSRDNQRRNRNGIVLKPMPA